MTSNPSSEQFVSIRASAGSGKTYRLTTRYAEILLLPAGPERILATTFTRKAAGEILQRLLLRLAEAATESDKRENLGGEIGCSDLSADDCGELLRGLCRRLHLVNISTLDSFFSRLALTNGFDIDLPFGATMSASGHPSMEAMRLEAVCALVEADSEISQLLEDLSPGRASQSVLREVHEATGRLYEIFLEATEECWNQIDPGEPPNEDAVEISLDVIRDLAETHRHGNWRKAFQRDAELIENRDWSNILGGGLTKVILQQSDAYYKVPVDDKLRETYAPIVAFATWANLKRLADRTMAIYSALSAYDREYEPLRRSRRMLLFSDVPAALAAFIPTCESGEVAYRLDSRIDHLMLDELQDTSLRQWSILEPFKDAIVRGGGAKSIFGVGDVKQAIYGWRGACPEIFDTFERSIPGLTKDELTTSYRSSRIVLDAVNRLFGGLVANVALAANYASTAAAWQAGFSDHVAADLRKPGYVSLQESVEAERETEDQADALGASDDIDPHFAFAARAIAEIAARAPDRSIGVLTRSNVAANAIMRLLRSSNTPVSGEGGSPVSDDAAVELLLSALTLADHPGDTAAAFHLAHSPLRETLTLTLEAGDRTPKPSVAWRASRELRSRILERGCAALLTDLARVIDPPKQSRSAERVAQLVGLAEAFDRRSGPCVSELIQIARTVDVAEPASVNLRVMTIHAAKGLEFDFVVLPELHKKLEIIPTIVVERANPAEAPTAVFAYPNKLTASLMTRLGTAVEAHKSREMRESLSLLYVAMTRARYELRMIVPAEVKALSFASVLMAGLPDPDASPRPGFPYELGDPDWRRSDYFKTDAPIVSAGPDVTPESPAPPTEIRLKPAASARRSVAPSSADDGNGPWAHDLFALKRPIGERIGTAAHALFEAVEWTDDPLPLDSELIGKARAEQPGEENTWYEDVLTLFHKWRVQAEVRNALTRPTVGPDESIKLWRETPFVVLVDGEVVEGRFDRVVLIEQVGVPIRATILDYKTDTCDIDNVSTFVDRHMAQLNLYRRALATMIGIPASDVTAELMFVRPDLRRVVKA